MDKSTNTKNNNYMYHTKTNTTIITPICWAKSWICANKHNTPTQLSTMATRTRTTTCYVPTIIYSFSGGCATNTAIIASSYAVNADTRNYTAEFPLYVYASILPTIRKTRITPMMFIIYLDIAITTITTTTTTTSSVRQNTPPIANKTVAHTLVLKIV